MIVILIYHWMLPEKSKRTVPQSSHFHWKALFRTCGSSGNRSSGDWSSRAEGPQKKIWKSHSPVLLRSWPFWECEKPDPTSKVAGDLQLTRGLSLVTAWSTWSVMLNWWSLWKSRDSTNWRKPLYRCVLTAHKIWAHDDIQWTHRFLSRFVEYTLTPLPQTTVFNAKNSWHITP